MATRFYLDGVELAADRVRIDAQLGLTSSADGGSLGTGVIEIDDPDGTLTVTGWMTFHVTEDQSSTPRIWTGYIYDRQIARGRPEHLLSTARTFVCTIVDLNTNLGLRTFTQDAAKRPRETDIARVAWMLTQTQATDDSRINDNGLVSTSNAGAFDEADYRGQYPGELLESVAASSVKNFYMYHDSSTGEASLFYDKPNSTVRTSTLRISNAGDEDNDITFAPIAGSEVVLTTDPSSTFSGVRYGWLGGFLYVENATTETNFIARDANYSTDRIGRLTTAQSQSTAWLDVRSTEQDRITVRIQLPIGRVNDILEGQRVQVKFTHLLGYTSFTYIRVVRRTVRIAETSPRLYEVELELSNSTPLVSGGSAPSTFPYQCTPGAPTHVQTATISDPGHGSVTNRSATFLATASAGNLLIICLTVRDDPGTVTTPTGWTKAVERNATTTGDEVAYVVIFYKTADGTETGASVSWTSASPAAMSIHEYGANSATLIATGNTWNVLDPAVWPTLAATAGSPAVLIFFGASKGGGDETPASVTNRATLDYAIARSHLAGDILVESADASYALTGAGGGATYVILNASFQVVAACPEPLPGQPVNNATPDESTDGTTADFTAPNPYATGSMRVQVQGIDVTDFAVTESDPTTGAFSLDFAPLATETVTLYYLGR